MTKKKGQALLGPKEVSVFVDEDGGVTFSDLPADLVEVVKSLDPESLLACDRPSDLEETSSWDPKAPHEGLGEVRPVWLDGDEVVLLDQRLLPHEEVYVRCQRAEEVAKAIREMVVRGAPAIGITAAMGLAVELLRARDEVPALEEAMEKAAGLLIAARPTAVNLAWAVERMKRRFQGLVEANVEAKAIKDALLEEAQRILEEDVEMNRAIGRHGQGLIPDGATVMTHCNAGALATGGYGTALGVIRAAREAGKKIRVIACETRPYLQGARLTAWELGREGFDVTLITDNAAGYLMAKGEVSCVVVGADRIAANGDVANKVGTYTHAVLAARHGIPFYVAAPSSTLDPETPDGSRIPIEERPEEEVLGFRGIRVAPPFVKVRNPAFDITPWSLVTAIITERGVHRPGPDGYDFRRR